MQIKKITLNSHGLRGASVEYLKWETTKEGRRTLNTITEKKQTPVQLKLENLAKSLRINLLEICRVLSDQLTEDDAKFILQECEITGIEINDEWFVLSGTLLAFEDKTIKLKTPKVSSADGYGKFDMVQDIILEIKNECKEYLSGTQKITNEEIVLRWIQAGKSGVKQSDFDNLSSEEKKEFCKDFLEKEYGAMIMMNDELSEVDESKINDVIAISTLVEPFELTVTEQQFNKAQVLTPEDIDFIEAPLTEENEEF